MTKKVVLCVPIHNAALTLEETLKSLLLQDHPIYKIKLFNNASTDATADIIERYRKEHPAIEVYTGKVLVSAEDNFTNCIQGAEGDYCAIVHSDDVYEKNFIRAALAAFERNEECVAVFCHAREIDLGGKVIGERPVPAFLKKSGGTYLNYRELLMRTLEYSNFLTCPSAVVRSAVYRDVVKSWNGKEFKTSADLETWLRVSREGLIYFNPRPLMRYRVALTSLSFRMAKTRVTKHDLFLVLSKYVRENADWLPSSSLDDYKFLNFKDEAFRILNARKNKLPLHELTGIQEVEWRVVLPRTFRSKWHLKMTLGIMAARLLRAVEERGV